MATPSTARPGPKPAFLFSQVFQIPSKTLADYNAFDISLVTDLPLFIDPFLLFSSDKLEYRQLHDEIIKYLAFLRDKSTGAVGEGQLDAWYRFKEVKQTWLGFCSDGNDGHGLGKKFARALNTNFSRLFPEFGQETITEGTHLEKLCLVGQGVGRDTISDFTTNLAKRYLLEYTERFATQHLSASHCKQVSVSRAYFDYGFERWVPRTYYLPIYRDEYVLLTPKDILTKDETWINRGDIFRTFDTIPDAIPNAQLRAEINNYFVKVLPLRAKKKERDEAIAKTVLKFPALIDYYIRQKELNGDAAKERSIDLVIQSQRLFVEAASELAALLNSKTAFYATNPDSAEATRSRILFLKDVIENKGGYRAFYSGNTPVAREDDLQIMFRLTWFAPRFDVTREANDGRGPVDFKISSGVEDKTLVEMKMASNSQLEKNLEHQLEIYQKASDAPKGFKVVMFFTLSEQKRVERILSKLNLLQNENVILIDARRDNKPSASKAGEH